MKKAVFLVLIQIFVSLNVFSQYYFYVSPLNEEAKPSLKESGMSNNEALNQIFKEFEVKSYYQSFPEAKNAELRSFYEIHLTGNKERNIDSFESLLKNSGAFDAVYRSDYYEPAECSNPVPINDTWIVNNWINNDALNLLDAQCAWTVTEGDPDIIVGVIDTEFETTHEDLINTFAGIVGTPSYPQNHGTSVSSCVAVGTNNNKGIAGIGYKTRVKGYCVSGTGVNNSLWNNIWQAYLDGIKIINVSWTGIGSYPNLLAIQEMTENGVVLVVAAGNHPDDTCHSAYADIPGVIDVSGVNANNDHGPTGHAHNQWVDVCALSKSVALCVPGNTYGTIGGTSFAAPQVAGVAALIRSINGSLSSADIENIIKATTDSIADAYMYPGLIGTGRVNAYKAVQAAACTVPANFTNRTVTTNTTVTSCGDINVQNVIVTNGAKLTLNAAGEVNIISDFEVELGSEFEIIE
jgi:subtilisin family serine protease